MSSVIYVKYIGRKARARDRLYDSGVIWNGHGDIRPVDSRYATRLLSHSDAFVEATEEEYRQQDTIDHGDEAVDATALEAARARAARGVSPMSEATEAAAREREPVTVSDLEDQGIVGDESTDTGEESEDGEGEDATEGESEGEAEEPAANATEEHDEAEGPQKPEKPVSQMSKRACAEYAERQFGHEIDVDSLDVHACRKEVRELMVGAGLVR